MIDNRNDMGDVDLTPEEQAAFDAMMKAQEPELPLGLPESAPEPAEAPEHAPEPAAAPEAAKPEVKAEKAEADPDGTEEGVVVGKDGKPRGKDGKFVPHQALHSEREKRKAKEAEAEKYKELAMRGDERLQMLVKMLEDPNAGKAAPAPAKEKPAPIDPTQDFIGAIKQIQEAQGLTQKQIEEERTRTQADEAERVVGARYQTELKDFASKEPAFADAMRHLITVRHATLEVQGVTDKAQRDQIIAREERELVHRAYKSNQSPAQQLLGLAKAYGFAPRPAAAPTNGQAAPAAAPTNGAARSAADRIENSNKIMKAMGPSLSNAPSGGGDAFSPSQLMNMDEDEYANFVSKLGEKAFAKRFLGA